MGEENSATDAAGGLPKADKPLNGSNQKLAYRSPKLVVYGSVRELTGANSGVNNGDATKMMISDPALKERVVRVGDHPAGFGLYLFDFKKEFCDTWGHGRQFGVMADEVQRIVPEAIAWHEDGYMVVNYASLGIHRIGH
jgi:hypothetical protein